MINITEHNQEIIKKFYEDNKDSIIELKPNKIKLVDKIHKEDKHVNYMAHKLANMMKEENKELDKVVVVRKINKIGYVLVSGLKWYYVAKSLKCNLKCIVIDSNLSHINFNGKYGIIDTSVKQPKDTEKYIHYSNLFLGRMQYCNPRKTKVQKKFETFNEGNGIDKAIAVKELSNGMYLIQDQYINYLWLKDKKERFIPIKIIKGDEK